jgi:hypothetical protein
LCEGGQKIITQLINYKFSNIIEMVLEERKKKKLFFVSLSSPQAPRFLKKWGSQHFKRNHESIALPVALIGLCIFLSTKQ